MTALASWQNFYVIVGSSAGALIGLQFVVMSLIADLPATRAEAGASAFATPTIVHFAAVLALAGIMNAPWEGNIGPAICFGLVGLAGAIYSIVISRRMRHTAYKPEFEDWLFHAILPLVAYVTLGISSFAAPAYYARESLFAVGAAVLLLLFIGIHNAWDAVTYHIFARKRAQELGEPKR